MAIIILTTYGLQLLRPSLFLINMLNIKPRKKIAPTLVQQVKRKLIQSVELVLNLLTITLFADCKNSSIKNSTLSSNIFKHEGQ